MLDEGTRLSSLYVVADKRIKARAEEARAIYGDELGDILAGREITNRQFAAAAGISEAMVTYIIAGKRYPKESTHQRIIKALKKLCQKPLPTAKSHNSKS